MKVIEVAMEIAFPPDFLERVWTGFGSRPARDIAMSTSVGGIGPLLRERLVAQPEKGVDVIGVTLLYENTWIQSWFDWGQLHLEKREVASTARQLLKDTGIKLSFPLYDGTMLNVAVWKVDYGKAPVYFLDCPPLTHVVYPSEEDAPPKQPNAAAWADELRQQQSWIVGRGALALAKALSFAPDLIVQSETPTLFAHHRIAIDGFHDDPFFAKTRYIFNDHTPLEYAHPVWPKSLCARLKLDATGYIPVPGAPDNGDIDITRLLIGKVEGVFGVAKKHGRVMREMPSLRDFAPKIESITNGIYIPYWQAGVFQSLEGASDQDLLRHRQEKKAELLDWVWRHYGLWHTWKEQVQGKGVVLWTRRITGYKRMDILWTLCKDTAMRKQFLDANIVMLIGGRIHQHDDQAQTMIYNLLDLISQDKNLQERVVFLDNFNVWMAPRLFQGTDAAIMLADDGREASATGFMKAQANGAVVIATDDGAIPESVIFMGREGVGPEANGIEVPYVNGHPTAEGLVRAFKTLRGVLKTPAQHAKMIRAALAMQKQFSIYRTVDETINLYNRVLETPAPVPSTNPT